MSCSSCKYLCMNDKKNGSVGCLYYCKKSNNYVNGSNNNCDSYTSAVCRKNYEINSIYKDGSVYSNDNHSISFYLFILIIMLVLLFIKNVFGL